MADLIIRTPCSLVRLLRNLRFGSLRLLHQSEPSAPRVRRAVAHRSESNRFQPTRPVVRARDMRLLSLLTKACPVLALLAWIFFVFVLRKQAFFGQKQRSPIHFRGRGFLDAEGVGFEPTIPVKVCWFSRPVHSTRLCHPSGSGSDAAPKLRCSGPEFNEYLAKMEGGNDE